MAFELQDAKVAKGLRLRARDKDGNDLKFSSVSWDTSDPSIGTAVPNPSDPAEADFRTTEGPGVGDVTMTALGIAANGSEQTASFDFTVVAGDAEVTDITAPTAIVDREPATPPNP